MRKSDEYLNPTEKARFEAGRSKFLAAVALVAALSVTLFVLSHFVLLDEYIWMILLAVFAATINVIVRSWFYKCPRCNKVPTAKRISFGGDVSYSSAIALMPKQCSHCGVHFKDSNEKS